MSSLISGKIYKISSPNTDKIYIGSTTGTLSWRFRKHTYNWKHKNLGKYCSSEIILAYGNARIELLEEVEVENLRDLRRIEQRWILKLCNTVNIKDAFSSELETLEKNKKRNKERYRNDPESKQYYINYSKKYREKNKEYILQTQREKREYCNICNTSISYGKLQRHERSIKHIFNFILS